MAKTDATGLTRCDLVDTPFRIPTAITESTEAHCRGLASTTPLLPDARVIREVPAGDQWSYFEIMEAEFERA